MAAVAAPNPTALSVSCPYCGKPPLERCIGSIGRQVPVHQARKRAAEQEVSTGG